MLRHTHAPVHYFQNGIATSSIPPVYSYPLLDILSIVNFLHESKSHFSSSTKQAITEQFQKVTPSFLFSFLTILP
jgi:hypothetical protein